MNNIKIPSKKINLLIKDAIKKCHTHGITTKDIAQDLRYNGFEGSLISDLVKEAELTLKYAHAYQSYWNSVE